MDTVKKLSCDSFLVFQTALNTWFRSQLEYCFFAMEAILLKLEGKMKEKTKPVPEICEFSWCWTTLRKKSKRFKK